MQGVGRCACEGASEQDGAVGFLGEINEGGQAGTQTGNGTRGVDDEQAHIELADGGAEMFKITREVEGTEANGGLRRFLDEGTIEDQAGGVTTGGFEVWPDGVGGGLIGGNEQEVGWLSGCAIG